MTHEELLANINAAIRDRNADYGLVKGLYALRSVVELHKPQQRCYDATCYCKDMCYNCKEDYPCSTIQAIEKELV